MEKMRILTLGTFDLFHWGHAEFLSKCSQLGDLTVGVNTDEFVLQYKGQAPVVPFKERVYLLSALGYQWGTNSSAGREYIENFRPDILAIGSDWARKDYLKQIDMTQDLLDEMRISLIYIPYTKGVSSTWIRERMCGIL